MASIYVEVTDPRFMAIDDKIKNSYPDCCILWMEEIVNHPVSAKFETLKKSSPIPYEIKELFHGTNQKFLDSIIKNGFKREHQRISAYGHGYYLSTSCSTAMQYTDPVGKNDTSFVFLCDVYVGRTGVMKSSKPVNRTDYDCSVNSTTDPSIFCIPAEEMIVPKFLVLYQQKSIF